MKKSIKTFTTSQNKVIEIAQNQMNVVKGGKSRPPKTGCGSPLKLPN